MRHRRNLRLDGALCVIRLFKTGLISVYNLKQQNVLNAPRDATVEWIDGTGAKTTMKYPSVYPDGEGARVLCLIAFANAGQHQDTGADDPQCSTYKFVYRVKSIPAKGGGKVDYRGQVTLTKL